MKVKIVAYMGRLVMVPIEPHENIGNGWFPTGSRIPGGGLKLGCVLMDTGRRLGVSSEAFELMRKVRRSPNSLGDLSWWPCQDNTHAFSWFGSIHRVINPEIAEATEDFRVNPHRCIVIPNEVPAAAKTAILTNPDCVQWTGPYRVNH